MLNLTTKESETAMLALRVAIEQYKKDVDLCVASEDERIARQFESQILEAQALHDKIKNAAY